MEIVKGGQYIIKHQPSWGVPPIIIQCTVRFIGKDENIGKVIVDTDLQKGVVAYIKDLRPLE